MKKLNQSLIDSAWVGYFILLSIATIALFPWHTLYTKLEEKRWNLEMDLEDKFGSEI